VVVPPVVVLFLTVVGVAEYIMVYFPPPLGITMGLYPLDLNLVRMALTLDDVTPVIFLIAVYSTTYMKDTYNK
jgi:hypothetical protein